MYSELTYAVLINLVQDGFEWKNDLVEKSKELELELKRQKEQVCHTDRNGFIPNRQETPNQ